jgi:UDP-N-acetylglucosamine 2-epimerase (non-hydrolysing)
VPGGGVTMHVMTVLGTRPEIIRLSRVIPRLDALCQHTLVHTGQNFSESLNDVFFRELGIRSPDVCLDAHRPTAAAQIAAVVERIDGVLAERRPDRLLVLGDTDSGLAAVPAARRGIPVFHMEAGNRCYDPRVPEEINRRIIDHCSTVLMPYTHRSRQHLLREGFPSQRVVVTGNPIFEVLQHYRPHIEGSAVLDRLRLTRNQYYLATLHRAENVDPADRLRLLLEALARLARHDSRPVIVSLHPRTRARMAQYGLGAGHPGVRLLDPLSLFDFVALEQAAATVLTDSGTVQEECCLFGVPSVTLRDTTERMETVECGSSVIAGADPDAIVRSVGLVASLGGGWTPPPEYTDPHVSRTVARVVLGPAHASLPV